MAALLVRLLKESEGGLLTTVENRAKADTSDDFLDHGDEYLKRGPKAKAGVIAGTLATTRSGGFAASWQSPRTCPIGQAH